MLCELLCVVGRTGNRLRSSSSRYGRRGAAQTLKFDSNRAWEHLRQLVAIGPRPAGSPAIEQTRKYLKDQLGPVGVAVSEQAWDDQTPIGKVHMVNLVATIPGPDPGRRPGAHP